MGITVCMYQDYILSFNKDGASILNNKCKWYVMQITMPKVKLSLLEANTFIY